MTHLLTGLTDFITNTINHFGYLGVFLLMAIQSAAIPLPSEIIMPFAGFLVASGRFSILGLAFAGTAGSLIGSILTYALGYYEGRALVRRYGKYVLMSEKDLELTEKFFQKFGSWSNFLGRLLPIVRTFISIPAGIGEEPFGKFVLTTIAGSFIWSYFLAWLGAKLGSNWNNLSATFHKFDLLIIVLILAGFGRRSDCHSLASRRLPSSCLGS